MKPEVKLRGGDEYDAFGKYSRHFFHWKPGELKKIKRRYWKRVRKFESNALQR